MNPGGRQIRRWLFNAAALLSLLLAIAVAGLWIRSVWWTGDGVFLAKSHAMAVLYYSRGRLILDVCRMRDDMGPGSVSVNAYPPMATEWLPILRTQQDSDYITSKFTSIFFLECPDFAIIGLLSILPAMWIHRGFRQRPRPGFCSACGYDLRASNDACPECGEPIPVKAPIPLDEKPL